MDHSNKRDIYLPEGMGTDWWTNDHIEGNQGIKVYSDLNKLPLHVRQGSIIPMGPVMNYIDEIKGKEIVVKISLYEKNGKSTFFVPINEERVLIKYAALNRKYELKVSKTEGDFKIDAFGKDTGLLTVINE